MFLCISLVLGCREDFYILCSSLAAQTCFFVFREKYHFQQDNRVYWDIIRFAPDLILFSVTGIGIVECGINAKAKGAKNLLAKKKFFRNEVM